jgi:hypothetical protein
MSVPETEAQKEDEYMEHERTAARELCNAKITDEEWEFLAISLARFRMGEIHWVDQKLKANPLEE